MTFCEKKEGTAALYAFAHRSTEDLLIAGEHTGEENPGNATPIDAGQT